MAVGSGSPIFGFGASFSAAERSAATSYPPTIWYPPPNWFPGGVEQHYRTQYPYSAHPYTATDYPAEIGYPTGTSDFSASEYPYPTGSGYPIPTEFLEPARGWLNPFNLDGINPYGHGYPTTAMQPTLFYATDQGNGSQGPNSFDFGGFNNESYLTGTATALTPSHGVDQMSNTLNDADPVQTRPICMQCGRDFGRQSDLDRHMKKHQPDAQVYRCQVQGCQYSSKRKDKFMEHSRRPH